MIASFGMALRYSFDLGRLADQVDAAIAAVLASGLRTADIKSEGTTSVSTTQMGEAILRNCRSCTPDQGPRPGLVAGMTRGRGRSINTAKIPRISAEVRRRVQRLTVDRAIVVLAREGRISDFRRISVIGELAVARQNFDAGIEPGALGDVEAGATLLIDHVGTVRPVIGPAAVVELRFGSALADVMSKPTAMTAQQASNIASLFAAGNPGVIMSSRAAGPPFPIWPPV